MHKMPFGRFPVFALLFGAAGIGFAPVLVRLSEVGPIATAFYRIVIALPFLWIWMRLESAPRAERQIDQNPRSNQLSEDNLIEPAKSLHAPIASAFWLFALAGFCFAADLAFWHWSIKLTSVANSTLLSNLAPFFVTIGARFLLFERITLFLLGGMVLAFVGAAMLVSGGLTVTTSQLLGDFLGVVTALFYAGYLLTVKLLRRTFSTATILSLSGAVSCLVLMPAALVAGESFRPNTVDGWGILVLLGLLTHIGGQGLITFALAHLPASFTAVTLLFQPVIAALLAWLILAERISGQQAMGGCVILLGIVVASRGKA